MTNNIDLSDLFGKSPENMTQYELNCAITYMLHRPQFEWGDISPLMDIYDRRMNMSKGLRTRVVDGKYVEFSAG